MALTRRVTENDFRQFEAELLKVLKNDKEHSLDLKDSILFKSRRYGSLLSAKGVFWDKDKGDIVFVLSQKAGKPIYDDSKGFPEFLKEVSIPLRECYEDISMSSGEAPRLLDRIKDAVIDKYVMSRYSSFDVKGMLRDGHLIFKDFEERFPFMRGELVSLSNKDGKLQLICSNEIAGEFDFKFSRMPMYEIQNLGKELDKIHDQWNFAARAFHDGMKELEPQSMSFTEFDRQRHRSDALVKMYDKGFPLMICNSVAKSFANSDVFDSTRHSTREIAEAVAVFRQTGILEVKQKRTKESSRPRM